MRPWRFFVAELGIAQVSSPSIRRNRCKRCLLHDRYLSNLQEWRKDLPHKDFSPNLFRTRDRKNQRSLLEFHQPLAMFGGVGCPAHFTHFTFPGELRVLCELS
jgi:hypothetical protein